MCQFWNEIILSLPIPKIGLRLNHYHWVTEQDTDAVPFFDTSFTIDARIAKRISATCLHSAASLYPFASKLMYACDRFNEVVQILEISIDQENGLKSVHQVLQNFCPNLKELRITCKFKTATNQNVIAAEVQQLVEKPGLTIFIPVHMHLFNRAWINYSFKFHTFMKYERIIFSKVLKACIWIKSLCISYSWIFVMKSSLGRSSFIHYSLFTVCWIYWGFWEIKLINKLNLRWKEWIMNEYVNIIYFRISNKFIMNNYFFHF